MVQNDSFRGPGGTIDTPVGAQWPNAPAADAGSTDFGHATAGDLNMHSETLTAQSPEMAHIQATVEPDHRRQAAENSFTAESASRGRPSAAAVLGSAVMGAVAGGAIPFMLAGRTGASHTTTGWADQDALFGRGRSVGLPRQWGRSWRP